MKRIIKIFFILGLIFWGGMLSSAIVNLICYNAVFNLFDLEDILTKDYKIESDTLTSKSLIVVQYSYKVDHEIFEKKLNVNDKYFDENFEFGLDSSLVVRYNSTFPEMSFIPSIPLEKRKAKIGIILSLVFISFLLVLYFFGNLNKSVKNYEEVGSRPWLYPADQNEKNPFKRFMGRLFNK